MMQKATVSERRTVPKQQVIIALPFFLFYDGSSISPNIELWVKAVNYYKSLSYIETSYSNFLGDNPIITLTKVP